MSASDAAPPAIRKLPDDVKAQCWQKTLDSLLRPQPADDTPIELLQGSPQTFHGFTRLPFELREYIWKLYCPDLMQPVRIFELSVRKVKDPSTRTTGDKTIIGLPVPSVQLFHREFYPEDLKLAGAEWKGAVRHKFNKPTIRKLQTVHRETWALVQRVLPEKLHFELQGVIDIREGSVLADRCTASFRYNPNTDILVLEPAASRNPLDFTLSGLNFRKVGFTVDIDFSMAHLGLLLEQWGGLEELYICSRSLVTALPPKFLTWTLRPETLNVLGSFLRWRGPSDDDDARAVLAFNGLWCVGAETDSKKLNLSPPIKETFEAFQTTVQRLGVPVYLMHSFTARHFMALQTALEELEMQKMQAAAKGTSSSQEVWETLPYPPGSDWADDKLFDILCTVAEQIKQQKPTSGEDILKELPDGSYDHGSDWAREKEGYDWGL